MNNPDISIIMLTYNRQDFLRRSIESVLAQKNCSFEFIIINNGSTDNSFDICKSYAAIDNRIRLYNINKSNIGTGRNVGIDSSKGKYLSFVDDDDYMTEDMFEYLMVNSTRYNADISICGCYSDFGDHLEPFYVFNDLLILNKVEGINEFLKRERYNSANPCKLFKRQLFSDIRYLSSGKYDDIHTIYKLFANAEKTVVSGVPKYYFTKHTGNNSGFIQTNMLSPDQLSEYLTAFSQRTSYITEKVPEATKHVRYSEWSYMISMIDKIVQNNLTNCFGILDQIKQCIINNFDEFSSSTYITEREKLLLKKYF